MNTIKKINSISRNTVADGDNLDTIISDCMDNDTSLLSDSNTIKANADDVYNTVNANSGTKWNNELIHNFKNVIIKQHQKEDIVLTGDKKLNASVGFTLEAPLEITKNDNDTYSIIAPSLTGDDSSFNSYLKESHIIHSWAMSPFMANSKYGAYTFLPESFCLGVSLTTAAPSYPSMQGIKLGYRLEEAITAFSAQNADTYKTFAFSSYLTPTGIEIKDTSDKDNPVTLYTVFEQTIPTDYSFIYTPDSNYYGRSPVDNASIAFGTKFIAYDHSIGLKGAYVSSYSLAAGRADNGNRQRKIHTC